MASRGNSRSRRRVPIPPIPTRESRTPPSPPAPTPATPVAPAPPGLPNSARARAQRARQPGWNEPLTTVERPGRDVFGDVLVPTEEQREERDRITVQSQHRRVEIDPMEWWAREMARQGNDVYLFTYQPTPSINPPRPRTLAAGYERSTMTLRIRFRNGQVYGYYRVPPRIWDTFKGVPSPGRYINRVLNYFPYAPESQYDRPTGMT